MKKKFKFKENMFKMKKKFFCHVLKTIVKFCKCSSSSDATAELNVLAVRKSLLDELSFKANKIGWVKNNFLLVNVECLNFELFINKGVGFLSTFL